MFTSNENEYIRSLVISEYNNGYKYYLCKTINEYNNDYDFECYFTNQDISFNSSNFNVKDYKSIKVDTSSSYNVNNKVVNSTGTSKNLTYSTSDFYYSNTNSLVDITSDIKYDKLNNITYNLDLNFCYLIVLLLAMPIIVGLVHHFFGID